MLQIIDALCYLHNEKNIAHCDIKLNNMMVDDELNLTLIDFGYAACGNLEALTGMRGTKQYQAPEIKSQHKVYDGKKVDVFATGVILFILVVPDFPFEEASDDSVNYKLIIEGKSNEFWSKLDPLN